MKNNKHINKYINKLESQVHSRSKNLLVLQVGIFKMSMKQFFAVIALSTKFSLIGYASEGWNLKSHPTVSVVLSFFCFIFIFGK